MDFARVVGSPGIRIVSVLLAVLCVAEIGVQPYVAAGAGLLAALGLILSFRSSYDGWMRVASRIQTVVSALIFGACYLLLVPLFAVFVRIADPLGLRLREREGESSWVVKGSDANDARSYQRMG